MAYILSYSPVSGNCGVSSLTPADLAAARGFHVFPCRIGDKRPAAPDHGSNACTGTDPRCRNGHTGWEQRATTDPDRIRRAWAGTPWNIGVACGPSRLVVIDLDTHGDLPAEWQLPGIVTGADVLAQICEWAGMDWPHTYTVHTPSGGDHLYFRAPAGASLRNTAGQVGPMIDTRAAGGYVVGAGSVIGGRAYEVTDDQDPQPLPEWIAKLLQPKEPERRPAAGRIPASGPGRLPALVRIVSQSQARSRTRDLVWATFKLSEMIAEGHAAPADGEQLVAAAVAAGIVGGERYARQQVASVLGRAS